MAEEQKKWFERPEDAKVKAVSKKTKDIPEGLWSKCPSCEEMIYTKDLEERLFVCPRCGHHMRLSAAQRIKYLTDENSFKETDKGVTSSDPLKFKDDASAYAEKIKSAREKTKMNEAVICGVARINKIKVSLAVMDFSFFGGSMASAVGEKITRSIERAALLRIPLVIVSVSGGARMQEGILSLMQMAKTSAALARLSQARLPFISILTDPTTGGVTASFSMLGDVHIAEPNALIGFAGPRVIEQTIRAKLPPGFQRSEFLLEHGFVDIVVERQKLKETVALMLRYFYPHA